MKRTGKAFAAVLAAGLAVSSVLPASLTASAKWQRIFYLGDLNGDDIFSVADLVILSKYLLGADSMPETGVYNIKGNYYLSGRRDEIASLTNDDIRIGSEYLQKADIDENGVVDTFDLVALRKVLLNGDDKKLVYEWTPDIVEPLDPVDAPIYDLYGSLPSKGDARVAVFYVDFPDCKHSYYPSMDEVEKYLFGEADESSVNYPYESVAAFYDRSSKGTMKLSGEAYSYSAKNNISAYEGDIFHIDIINEVLEAYDDVIDFNDFDADKDGVIDSVLIVVPETAGKDNWWPTSGVYGGNKSENKHDDLTIGHVIVGNAAVNAENSYKNFCTTYCHELGHCMGLPDYYLYNTDDFQGMHGSGGFELMDDAIGDFGAASKLMLGWYGEDQVSVFDTSQAEQTFTLYNNETDDGNCVIIPCGTLADKYRSEFFIIEYATLDNNNSRLAYDRVWQRTGSGVRVYHVEATLNNNYTYPSWKYSTANEEETNYGKGRRFIRLVNDDGSDQTDNLFHEGDIINGSISGFGWYDEYGNVTVDSGFTVNVGSVNGDSCTITISH